MEVRFLDIRTVSRERLAMWESWLSPEKRQRLDNRSDEHRLQSLCADGLAREMLAQKLGCAPQEIVFTCNESGKPLTAGACFNVSHSSSVVVCAVSDVPVGIDVERIRPMPPRIARALAGEWEGPEKFWQFWTHREAAIKCRGEKLSMWKQEREEGLTFSCLTPPEGYLAAACEEKE